MKYNICYPPFLRIRLLNVIHGQQLRVMIFLDSGFGVYNLLFLLTIYGETICIYGNQRLQENEQDNAPGDTTENFSSIKEPTEITSIEKQDKCRSKKGMGGNT